MIIVPISGGKDSQLCAKLAAETGEQVTGLFLDTGFEHPITYAHIRSIGKLYGIEIQTIRAGNLENHILNNKAFPSPWQRSCTSRLKIRPTARYLSEIAQDAAQPIEVWWGMRSNESKSRSKKYGGFRASDSIDPHDLNADYPKRLSGKVSFRLPIVDLSTEEVFEQLKGEENPLYRDGFGRVGCFPCLASSRLEHQRCFLYDQFGRSQKIRIAQIERVIQKKHAPAETAQVCLFCEI